MVAPQKPRTPISENIVAGTFTISDCEHDEARTMLQRKRYGYCAEPGLAP